MHLFLIGATPAASVKQMEEYLKKVVMNITKSPNSLVFINGTEFLRAFHKLKASELSLILFALQNQDNWIQKCRQNNLSAGTIISVSSDGVGTCTMVAAIGGPFSECIDIVLFVTSTCTCTCTSSLISSQKEPGISCLHTCLATCLCSDIK